MLDLKRIPARNHIYDPYTKTMRHTNGTLYRTRSNWHRYLRMIAIVGAVAIVGTWALAEATYWAVDTFLLPKGTP